MRWLVSLTLAGLLFVVAATDGVAAKKKPLDQVGAEILETLQSFYPVRSTEMGIHEFDHRFADFSDRSVKAMVRKLKGHRSDLEKHKKDDLSIAERTNYRLLMAELEMALLNLDEIEWHKRSPQIYVDDIVYGLYYLMLSRHAPLEERVVPLIHRIEAVPGVLATARRNLKDPPPIYVEAALESLESASDFYREVAGELMKQFPDRADYILKKSTAAREAMNEFAHYLEGVKTGSPGSFAIGNKAFDKMLSRWHHLDYDADSLLAIGEYLLAEVDEAYRQQEEYVESFHQDGSDSVFVPSSFGKQDILDYYNWETQQIRVFLELNDVITVPEETAPVLVVETPPFLTTMISGIAYQPAGPFDDVQQGLFYVRPIPDNLDQRQLAARYRYVHRRGFRSSAVHEAYPGHHLQLQIAGLHADPVRRWHQNLMLIEGWALYCEELMYDVGLYGDEDPQQWLRILGGIRFRAARVVADVKLHTGQFTAEECVEWMAEALGADNDSDMEFLRKEVRRYTFTPTTQMSYLMGKREIVRLREAAMSRDGEFFSLADFHDELLAHGSIPPVLLWEIMELSPTE